MTPIPNDFAGFDRAAPRRRDEAWLAAAQDDPRARYSPVWRQQNLFAEDADGVRSLWLAPDEARAARDAARATVFLGEADGAPLFALALDDGHEFEPAALDLPGAWDDLRKHAAVLPRDEAEVLLFARGMTYWHLQHAFCGACGAPTEAREGGHIRCCASGSCDSPHFPRTDPAVIVLVTHEGRALLGRQAEWRAGQYSTLAGFVEPGETLEEAVAREVREESGVELTSVRYHSSQPWPFPKSLMIGFTAEAASDELSDETDDELEDVRWFTRDDLREGLAAGTLHLPSPFSISHRLIDGWLRAEPED